MFEPGRYLITTTDKVNVIWIHSEEQLSILYALRHQNLINDFEKIKP